MTSPSDVANGSGTLGLSAQLELELRRIPGVVNVSMGVEAGGETLIVLSTSIDDEVVAAVKRRVRAHDADLAIELVEVETLAPGVEPPTFVAWDAGDERVALKSITFDRTTGTAEVIVTYQDVVARSSASGEPLIAGASATLEALEALGVAIPFALVSVDQLGALAEASVVVCLRPLPDGNERIGVARAEDRVEAAARATLSALNRHLADEFARVGWSTGAEPIR